MQCVWEGVLVLEAKESRTLLIPPFIYLDTETTGLEKDDQVTEVAWNSNYMGPMQFFVQHTKLPNQWVIQNTDYLERIFLAPKTDPHIIVGELDGYCAELRKRTGHETVYMMGAVPGFDDRMLRRCVFEPENAAPPWSHRLQDIETAVAYYFGLPVPVSLTETRKLLGVQGTNAAPHTAQGDADEVKALHRALLILMENKRLLSNHEVRSSSRTADYIIERLRGIELNEHDGLNLMSYVIQRIRPTRG